MSAPAAVAPLPVPKGAAVVRPGSRSEPPPGPRLPAVAQNAWWLLDEASFLAQCRRRFGPVFQVPLMTFERLVHVADPAEVKRLFMTDPADAHAGEGNAILEPIVGAHSVLVLDRQPHLRTRKLLLPPFHGERMRALAPVMREEAEKELASWPVGEPLELVVPFRRLTMRVILRTVFGVRHPEGSPLEGALDELLDIGTKVALAPPLLERLGAPRRTRAREHVDGLLLDAIADRRAHAGDDDAPDDILGVLSLTRDEDTGELVDPGWVRDQLLTLLVAGHETTATALSWAFERLARTPHALAGATAAARGTGDAAYLDWTIQETLRSRPGLTYAMRRAKRDLEVGGYHVPAGWTVGASIRLLHRDPTLFPDPEAFKPERYAPDAPDVPGFAWLPFGGGTRRCLGAAFAQMELREVLRVVLGARDVSAPDPKPERQRRRAITHVPHKGARVVLSAA